MLFPVSFNENLWHVCIIPCIIWQRNCFPHLDFITDWHWMDDTITKIIIRHLIALATAVDLGIAILTL